MIIKKPGEKTLDAIVRTARAQSTNPVTTNNDEVAATIAHLYELVGALADELRVHRNDRGLHD